MILDPTTRATYGLNPATHTAYYTPIFRPPPPPEQVEPLQDGHDDVEQYVLSSRAPYVKTRTADLGTQTMAGIVVKGKRTTWTLPAASQGRDRPTVKIDEVWTSPELGVEMLAKHSDSRGNVSITRVTSIAFSEPDPSLFQLPPDYTLEKPQ